MIARFVILCLAVFAVVAKENETHYHYHMDGKATPKLAHKGEKWCRFKAWLRFSGCMTIAWTQDRQDQCRANRTDALQACAQANPEGAQSAPGRRLRSNKLQSRMAHRGEKWCRFKVWTRFGGCMSISWGSESRAICRSRRDDGLQACAQENQAPAPAPPSRRLSKSSLAHKGLRWCRTQVYLKFSGCMTLGWTQARRDACRATRASGLQACAQANPEQAQAEQAGSHLLLKSGHHNAGSSFCQWNNEVHFTACKARAAGSADKNAILKECEEHFNLKKSECEAARALSKMSKRQMSAQQHLFWCEQAAKHKWFWCTLWAKVRGGDEKDSRLAACDSNYNGRMSACAGAENSNQAQPAPNSAPHNNNNTTAL